MPRRVVVRRRLPEGVQPADQLGRVRAEEVDDRLASFLAFPPSFTGGVRVGAVRLGGNDLVLAGLDSGPGIVGTFLIAPSLTTTYAVAFDISLLNGVFVSS